MIPLQKLSSEPVVSEFLPPDDLYDFCHPEVDYELGGVALNDPSQGFNVYVWRAYIYKNTIVVDVPEDSSIEPTTLVVGSGKISEVALSFDQNMAPTIAYVEGGTGRLYWYDSFIPGQVTSTIGAGVTSPRCFNDDKRVRQTVSSDILLVYLRDGALYFRAQRDRFGVEYHLKDTDAVGIARQGMHSGLRVQIELIYAVDYDTSNTCGFTDVTDLLPGVTVVSNAVKLSGFVQLNATFTIENGEYRVKDNLYAEWGPWLSEPSIGSAGMIVQLRTEASLTFFGVVVVTIKLGNITCQWRVTTRRPWDCTAQFSGEPCGLPVGCLRFTGEDC